MLTPKRAAAVLLIYFSCWFAVSARLQMETRLSNWFADSNLVIGNVAMGKAATAWKGQIFALEIWDRALTPATAMTLTSGAKLDATAPEPLVAYDFMNGPPFADRMKSLPDLLWSRGGKTRGDPSQPMLNGDAWLVSRARTSALTADLRRTNQFALHVVCKATEGNGADSPIVTITPAPYVANLVLRQEGASLIFWFRSPLSARHAALTWTTPNAFVPNRSRNILYSYDGGDLSLYMDGKRAGPLYRMGPGAALARVIRHVRQNELFGYQDVYYAMMFFPAGALLGVLARNVRPEDLGAWTSAAALLIVPALLFECLLIAVSGRAFWLGGVILSVALSLGGALWINADRISRERVASA